MIIKPVQDAVQNTLTGGTLKDGTVLSGLKFGIDLSVRHNSRPIVPDGLLWLTDK